ncbi:hypothetical protein FRC16_001323, partial [Serendipita sp. 398]
EVNGDSTNEVYKWLKKEKSGLFGLSRIKWNFEKFLVDKNGHVVNRWASTTTPSSIESQIEKLLAQEVEPTAANETEPAATATTSAEVPAPAATV